MKREAGCGGNDRACVETMGVEGARIHLRVTCAHTHVGSVHESGRQQICWDMLLPMV